ncbi:PH domain-containing protein [Nocardia shimofusensis]|uniref:PH domain-containing protein n=1 Tax=Nocardia shimofusensis TaxID=228596 RepID=UPI00082BC4E8|nr:PH domain-containing protein [Nocardia shimofusensis]
MAMVRAGVVPGRRTAIYGGIAFALVVGVTLAVVAGFGWGRVFTGLSAGLVAGVAALVALYKRDAVVLTEDAIELRTPLTHEVVPWDRVVGARFALDEQARWSLALDLTGGDEEHGELVLLSIPPVRQPVSGAYDLRKREQVNEIREFLRRKRIAVTVLPEIAGALSEHWKIAPPTR